MVTPTSLLTLIFASLLPLRGAAEDRPWNVSVECQMVVLPQKAALTLLPDLEGDKKIEAAFAKIQDMISRTDAKLVTNLIGKSTAEKKSAAKSVEEFRYATEFDPPQVPTEAINDPEILKNWPVVGVTPTAFETRDIGASLEFQVDVDKDGSLLSVNVTAWHVCFLRWNKTDAGKLATGEHITVDQPIFHTMKTESTFTVKKGQRILIGMHKTPESPASMELFFLRVSATKTDH